MNSVVKPVAQSIGMPTGKVGRKNTQSVRVDLVNSVDRKVVLRGIAENAHLGAVLIIEGESPIYIDGVDSWESLKKHSLLRRRSAFTNRKVKPGIEVVVTGRLIADPETSTATKDGLYVHGADGMSYRIVGAKVEVAKSLKTRGR
ncbi:MAG: hypothetical protein H0T78_06140 [Longispora sp.]|nr:hypothetical protein [Longispora sp. (in: high G+C Gram-positive bacteria)]